VNDHGIMTGSVLVVQIREARDLPGIAPTFAEVTFDEQRQATRARPASKSPLWNEKFSFDVVTGKEVLNVSVCSEEFGGRRIFGTCEYLLSSLNGPDYTFDNWAPLKNDREQVVGQIKVSLQWIVSRVEFFNNLINKVDKELSDNQAELTYNENRLEILYGIFLTSND